MCTSIACRVSSTDPGCVFLNGNGAVEGTVCDSGKTCQKGSCLESKDAPHSDCLFGDDIVVNLQVIKDPLPYSQMTCEQVLNYLESVNQFPIIYCTIPLFRQTCCATCKSKRNRPVCLLNLLIDLFYFNSCIYLKNMKV